MKIKKGDNVIVIAGKEKGKTGKVVRAVVSMNKVVIEGLNVVKKHQRPRNTNEQGSMVSVSMPIHVSNVMLVDPKSGKPTRVGKKKLGDKMVRIARKSNQEV